MKGIGQSKSDFFGDIFTMRRIRELSDELERAKANNSEALLKKVDDLEKHIKTLEENNKDHERTPDNSTIDEMGALSVSANITVPSLPANLLEIELNARRNGPIAHEWGAAAR
jgi:uncharacterized protein YerC